jgi:hypothetical protein
MAQIERVPFALAISDPKLLKPRWDKLSKPQQVVLKAFYGLPLDESELYYWSIFQGGATYDSLGYVTSVTPIPYIPKAYDTLVLYTGRRVGKTDRIISTAVAYEITLGGHGKHLQPGQQMKVPFIAQTAGDAQVNMNFIRLALEASPMLAKQLSPDQVASEIRLTNGTVVEPLPANKSVGRGHAIPVWIGDETAFWYTSEGAANPDFEVQRAINYAQLQFPDAKQFLGTTPWAEQGIAYEAFEAGTEGRKLKCLDCQKLKADFCPHPLEERSEFEGVLVIHATTAAMENPVISKKKLVQIQKRDPEAFPRESLAQTLKGLVASWLDPDKVDSAVDKGLTERAPLKAGNRPEYIAAMDPAFRNDFYAFTIVHHDPKEGLMQDYVRYWKPEPGAPLQPGVILDEIKGILTEYGLENVYSDQYQLESLAAAGSRPGIHHHRLRLHWRKQGSHNRWLQSLPQRGARAAAGLHRADFPTQGPPTAGPPERERPNCRTQRQARRLGDGPDARHQDCPLVAHPAARPRGASQERRHGPCRYGPRANPASER